VGAGSCADAPVPHQLQAQDHLHLQPRRPEEPLHRQASRQVTTVLLGPDPVGQETFSRIRIQNLSFRIRALQIRKMNFK
jgi:hypothetical protein